MDKNILIDAIIGKGFKSCTEAKYLTETGLAKRAKDTWEENWVFKRSVLENESYESLREIYNREQAWVDEM